MRDSILRRSSRRASSRELQLSSSQEARLPESSSGAGTTKTEIHSRCIRNWHSSSTARRRTGALHTQPGGVAADQRRSDSSWVDLYAINANRPSAARGSQRIEKFSRTEASRCCGLCTSATYNLRCTATASACPWSPTGARSSCSSFAHANKTERSTGSRAHHSIASCTVTCRFAICCNLSLCPCPCSYSCAADCFDSISREQSSIGSAGFICLSATVSVSASASVAVSIAVAASASSSIPLPCSSCSLFSSFDPDSCSSYLSCCIWSSASSPALSPAASFSLCLQSRSAQNLHHSEEACCH
jgi:hypothetical protein